METRMITVSVPITLRCTVAQPPKPQKRRRIKPSPPDEVALYGLMAAIGISLDVIQILKAAL